MMELTAVRSEEVLADLVRRARAGEQAAFDALVARYRHGLLTIARLRVLDRDEAEDLVQDTLTAAWTQLPAVRDDAAFAGWLHVILIHACHRWQRRRVRWPASLEELERVAPVFDPSPTPPEVVLERERWRRRRAALEALPPASRVPLLLFACGRCSYDEIARLLDMPRTTVEGRIFRARRLLRALLADDAALFDPKEEG